MKKYLPHLLAIMTISMCLRPSLADAQSDNDQYVSVLGNLNVGTELYDKRTHQLFGIVKDITWGKVEVLTASSVRVGGGTMSAATQVFSRSEITSNYVTKVKR